MIVDDVTMSIDDDDRFHRLNILDSMIYSFFFLAKKFGQVIGNQQAIPQLLRVTSLFVCTKAPSADIKLVLPICN